MPTGLGQGVVARLRRAALFDDDGGLPDAELLGLFLARRDEAAFACLVRRHGPMVLGVCRRVLRHAQDAEEAFQTTFLVLARKSASVRPREQVGNWLHGVAYRTALEARRRANRRRARETTLGDVPHPAVEPSVSEPDLRPVLDDELRRLPDKYRLPIVLCDLESRTRKDVARQLGLPEGTLSNRLAAGREMLAKRLARRGLGLSVGCVPCVPAALMTSTVSAVTAGAVSAEVAELTKGVLETMCFTKLKAATALFTLVGLLGAAGVCSTLGQDKAGGEKPPAKRPDPVAKAAPAQKADAKEKVVQRGALKAAQVSDVAAGRDESTIRWVVADGTEVKKGDKLAELDDTRLQEEWREHRLALAAAIDAKAAAEATHLRVRRENEVEVSLKEIDVKFAELQLKRAGKKEPDEKEFLVLKVKQAQLMVDREKLRGEAKMEKADADLKAASTAVAKAAARVDDLDARVAACVLRAPHAGVAVHDVSTRSTYPLAAGETVRPKEKVLRVHNLDRLLLAAYVDEKDISRVRPGQPVSVRIDAYPGRTFRGKVINVATEPSKEVRQEKNINIYGVAVELADVPRGLKPGMTGEATIEVERPTKGKGSPGTDPRLRVEGLVGGRPVTPAGSDPGCR